MVKSISPLLIKADNIMLISIFNLFGINKLKISDRKHKHILFLHTINKTSMIKKDLLNDKIDTTQETNTESSTDKSNIFLNSTSILENSFLKLKGNTKSKFSITTD